MNDGLIATARMAKQKQFRDHMEYLTKGVAAMNKNPTLANADLIIITAKQVRETATWLINNSKEE